MRNGRIGRVGLLVLAVALWAMPAAAQNGSGVFGGGAGAAVPVGDFSDDFNEGALYGAWMGIGLYDHGDLVFRLQQAFVDQKREDDFLFGDTDVTLTTITVGPKFYFTPPSFVARPFVAGGIGWTRVENDDGGANVLEDDDRFAFDVGGGLEFGRATWGLGAEVRYHRNVGSGDDTDLGYVVPMAVFTWRLLP